MSVEQPPMKWKLAQVGDKRDGPSESFKAPPDAPKAVRAMAVITKVLAALSKSASCKKASSALRGLLFSDHVTLQDMASAVSHEATSRFWAEMANLWMMLTKLGLGEQLDSSHLTRLQNKADEALQNKVAVARSCEASTDKEQCLAKLFERIGALAHRWCNEPNTSAPAQRAKNGALAPAAPLQDQCKHISALWEPAI